MQVVKELEDLGQQANKKLFAFLFDIKILFPIRFAILFYHTNSMKSELDLLIMTTCWNYLQQ